jgi:hypothetical protein
MLASAILALRAYPPLLGLHNGMWWHLVLYELGWLLIGRDRRPDSGRLASQAPSPHLRRDDDRRCPCALCILRAVPIIVESRIRIMNVYGRPFAL